MAIMRWDPFGEMLRLQKEMDRAFCRLGGPPADDNASSVWMPRVDVLKRGDDLVVHAELPGIDPADVDIEVTDGVLSIRGERKRGQTKEGEGWLVSERAYGSFERSFSLPEGVEPSSITADFKDGVLEVVVPKAVEAAKPKTVKVAIGK